MSQNGQKLSEKGLNKMKNKQVLFLVLFSLVFCFNLVSGITIFDCKYNNDIYYKDSCDKFFNEPIDWENLSYVNVTKQNVTQNESSNYIYDDGSSGKNTETQYKIYYGYNNGTSKEVYLQYSNDLFNDPSTGIIDEPKSIIFEYDGSYRYENNNSQAWVVDNCTSGGGMIKIHYYGMNNQYIAIKINENGVPNKCTTKSGHTFEMPTTRSINMDGKRSNFKEMLNSETNELIFRYTIIDNIVFVWEYSNYLNLYSKDNVEDLSTMGGGFDSFVSKLSTYYKGANVEEIINFLYETNDYIILSLENGSGFNFLKDNDMYNFEVLSVNKEDLSASFFFKHNNEPSQIVEDKIGNPGSIIYNITEKGEVILIIEKQNGQVASFATSSLKETEDYAKKYGYTYLNHDEKIYLKNGQFCDLDKGCAIPEDIKLSVENNTNVTESNTETEHIFNETPTIETKREYNVSGVEDKFYKGLQGYLNTLADLKALANFRLSNLSCDEIKDVIQDNINDIQIPQEIPFSDEVFSLSLDGNYLGSIVLENKILTEYICDAPGKITYKVDINKNILTSLETSEDILQTVLDNVKIEGTTIVKKIKLFFIKIGLGILSS